MPLNTLLCLGLSYKTAPLAVREQAGFDAARSAGLLFAAGYAPALRGVAVLSTCGRTELYADVRGDLSDARAHLAQLLADATGHSVAALDAHLYTFAAEDAARHLCRVAAGLESAVPGEPEILGQVAAAYETTRAAGAGSARLGRLFDTAVRAGRRARRETGINREATGLGAVPVRLAAEYFGALHDRHVLVIGGGQMGQAALHALGKQPVGRLTVASRRIETALALAQRHRAHAACLHSFRALVPEVDVVIAAASAPAPIVDRALVEEALAARPGRPLFVADLGLPRNVAADVADVPGVILHDLDALKRHVHATLEARRSEAPRVEAIIGEEIALLRARERQEAARPTVRALRHAGERIRREALDEALEHLPGLDEAARRHVESLTRRLVNRLLRAPTEALLHEAESGDAAPLADAARTLFALPAHETAPLNVSEATGAPDRHRAETTAEVLG